MKKRPVEFIAILYLVIWTITPPFQIDMIYRLLALGCAAILFLKNGFAITKQHTYALFFCLLVALNTWIMQGNISAILSQIGIYMLFIGYVMNYWYESDWEDFDWIVPLTLLLLAFWNFKTVSVLATNPTVARLVVRGDETANYYARQGVGGYALMYCQVIIVPAIVSWIIAVFKRNKMFFAIGIVWAVSFVAYLAEAGYSIAVVASLIGAIVLFAYKRKNIAPALAISAAVLFLLVYLIGYNEAFRNFLLNVFDGTKVARKIMDITSTVTTDKTADSIALRIEHYMSSLETILNYPLIGSWWGGGGGGHSAMLDAFARYGLFGGWMMFRMVYYVPLLHKKATLSPLVMRTANATIITLSFVVWLDTIPFNLTMMLMVILPIIMSDLEKWSEKNESLVDGQLNTDGSGGCTSHPD